jgi:hypothetical protein
MKLTPDSELKPTQGPSPPSLPIEAHRPRFIYTAKLSKSHQNERYQQSFQSSIPLNQPEI